MRLFLAARLPGPLEQELARLRAEWAARLAGWRFLSPESVHLTLRFLGETTSSLDLAARPDWRRAAARAAPFRCALGAAGRFPERGPARVLWLGLEEREPGQALADLACRLEEVARERGFAAEPRSFRPHLTLARSRPGARPDLPSPQRLLEGGEGWVHEILLFESRLSQAGARYTALEAFPLGAGGPPGAAGNLG